MLGRLLRRLAEEERPIRFLASRLLWHSGVSPLLTVQRRVGAGSYRIRFFPSSVSSMAWAYPERAGDEEEYVARVLQPGDTYLDVGANVGLLALCAASIVGREGRVIAVEAHPRTADFLSRNVALNGFDHVEIEKVAVGDEPGELVFTDRRSDDQNSVATAGEGGVRVPVRTLDELLPESRVGRIHLLKIDVEGFELAALRGATALLARVDRVLFESSPELCARFGYNCREVFDVLRGAGFDVRRMGETEVLPLQYEPTGFDNLVAERTGLMPR